MDKLIQGLTGLVVAGIGGVGFILGMIILMGLYIGWVATYLWSWFVLPVFEFMPHLTVFEAWGVVLVVSLFTGGYSKNADTKSTGMMLFGPILLLGTGYLIQRFLMGT